MQTLTKVEQQNRTNQIANAAEQLFEVNNRMGTIRQIIRCTDCTIYEAKAAYEEVAGTEPLLRVGFHLRNPRQRDIWRK